jgi:hypothetical protein
MEFHGIMNSIEFYETEVDGIPWNSMEFHGKFYGIPWNLIPWNSVNRQLTEFDGIRF